MKPKTGICRLRSLLFGTAAVCCVSAPAVFAASVEVSGPTAPFEMDGNALQDGAQDDWDNYPGASATSEAVPTPDPAPQSIFTQGGSKDIRDISQWKHTSGSVPDKDDITNGAALAYLVDPGNGDPEEEIIVVGGDRYSNDGDSDIGVWLFVNPVSLTGNAFDGVHSEEDVLIQLSMQGNDAVNIHVYEWEAACKKAASNNPGEGDCAAPNILLVKIAENAKCDPSGLSDQFVCAITNVSGGVGSAWPYEAKPNISLGSDIYPERTFAEMAINIPAIFGSNRCFASYLLETGSSTSFSSQLKDFILDGFPLCEVSLTKTCPKNGVFDPNEGGIPLDWTATVTNTGFATVPYVTIYDDNCGLGPTASDTYYNVAAGDDVTLEGTCVVTPADLESGDPIVNTAWADAGDFPVNLTSCPDPDTENGTCSDLCDFSATPDLIADKNCVTRLEVVGENVVVRVDFNGTITNPTDPNDADAFPEPLVELSGSDNKYGALTFMDCLTDEVRTRIEVGETLCFEGSYFPGETNSTCPSDANFSDMVQVDAVGELSGDELLMPATASASCKLCPEGGCEDLP